MKFVADNEYFLVKGSASFPRGILERPEVYIPKVFHENETSGRVMADQVGHRDIDVAEKSRNVGIVQVFHTLWVVMDQNG
jgi:hypothetical protein